jgi:hypothetical protein
MRHFVTGASQFIGSVVARVRRRPVWSMVLALFVAFVISVTLFYVMGYSRWDLLEATTSIECKKRAWQHEWHMEPMEFSDTHGRPIVVLLVID